MLAGIFLQDLDFLVDGAILWFSIASEMPTRSAMGRQASSEAIALVCQSLYCCRLEKVS